MIEVGQKVRFKQCMECKGYAVEVIQKPVVGTVAMVNEAHKWFSVEYGEPKMRTSFKFSEEGVSFTVCK